MKVVHPDCLLPYLAKPVDSGQIYKNTRIDCNHLMFTKQHAQMAFQRFNEALYHAA